MATEAENVKTLNFYISVLGFDWFSQNSDLTDRQILVLSGKHKENLTRVKISSKLNVSEQRVRQIYSAALRQAIAAVRLKIKITQQFRLWCFWISSESMCQLINRSVEDSNWYLSWLAEFACKPLSELSIETRTYNRLIRCYQLKTIADVCTFTEDELLQIPNFGVYALNDLRQGVQQWITAGTKSSRVSFVEVCGMAIEV